MVRHGDLGLLWSMQRTNQGGATIRADRVGTDSKTMMVACNEITGGSLGRVDIQANRWPRGPMGSAIGGVAADGPAQTLIIVRCGAAGPASSLR